MVPRARRATRYFISLPRVDAPQRGRLDWLRQFSWLPQFSQSPQRNHKCLDPLLRLLEVSRRANGLFERLGTILCRKRRRHVPPLVEQRITIPADQVPLLAPHAEVKSCLAGKQWIVAERSDDELVPICLLRQTLLAATEDISEKAHVKPKRNFRTIRNCPNLKRNLLAAATGLAAKGKGAIHFEKNPSSGSSLSILKCRHASI